MRVGVISDTHDNIWVLDKALDRLEGVEAVIHCGDLCSPFIINQIGDRLSETPVHIVWGNNDGDQFLIARNSEGYPNIMLHGQMAEVELDDRRVAVNHYPQIARGLANSGDYHLVCYGHDHNAHEEWIGECLFLNPGEVMGMKGRRTLAIVETSTMGVEWIDLEG